MPIDTNQLVGNINQILKLSNIDATAEIRAGNEIFIEMPKDAGELSAESKAVIDSIIGASGSFEVEITQPKEGVVGRRFFVILENTNIEANIQAILNNISTATAGASSSAGTRKSQSGGKKPQVVDEFEHAGADVGDAAVILSTETSPLTHKLGADAEAAEQRLSAEKQKQEQEAAEAKRVEEKPIAEEESRAGEKVDAAKPELATTEAVAAATEAAEQARLSLEKQEQEEAEAKRVAEQKAEEERRAREKKEVEDKATAELATKAEEKPEHEAAASKEAAEVASEPAEAEKTKEHEAAASKDAVEDVLKAAEAEKEVAPKAAEPEKAASEPAEAEKKAASEAEDSTKEDEAEPDSEDPSATASEGASEDVPKVAEGLLGRLKKMVKRSDDLSKSYGSGGEPSPTFFTGEDPATADKKKKSSAKGAKNNKFSINEIANFFSDAIKAHNKDYEYESGYTVSKSILRKSFTVNDKDGQEVALVDKDENKAIRYTFSQGVKFGLADIVLRAAAASKDQELTLHSSKLEDIEAILKAAATPPNNGNVKIKLDEATQKFLAHKDPSELAGYPFISSRMGIDSAGLAIQEKEEKAEKAREAFEKVEAVAKPVIGAYEAAKRDLAEKEAALKTAVGDRTAERQAKEKAEREAKEAETKARAEAAKIKTAKEVYDTAKAAASEIKDRMRKNLEEATKKAAEEFKKEVQAKKGAAATPKRT